MYPATILRNVFFKKALQCKIFNPLFGNQLRWSSRHRDYVMEYWKERIGNREIVGYGFNGMPCYADRTDFPFPAIRFGEPTADMNATIQKEKGDWRLLSLEEKKKLYRYSYCQTFAEMKAPTYEWIRTLGIVIILANIGIWLYIYSRIFVYGELPDSYTQQAYEAQLARQLDLHVNEITGLSSKYDYQKKDWKSNSWLFPKPNPFADGDCFYGEDHEGEGEGHEEKSE